MITAEFILETFLTLDMDRDSLYKNHYKKFKPLTPFDAFNYNIASLYVYKGDNTDFKSQYSFSEFKNFFYDAVCYDEELPEYVQEKFIIFFEPSENAKIDKKLLYSTLDEIKTCIMKLKLDRAIENFWIKDNERKTKKVRELVFGYSHKCNSYALVRPLIRWAENHNRLNDEFIYKIFEYGYITGKRAERTRKKTV